MKYGNVIVDAIAFGASGGDVRWVGQVNTAVLGFKILKVGGQASVDDAGAVSAQSISSGNALLEGNATNVSATAYLGLGTSPGWQGAAQLPFAIQVSSGHGYVYERGAYKYSLGAVSPADVLSIEIFGKVVRYYKNRALVYTSAAVPAYPVFAATSLVGANASFADVKLTGGGAQSLSAANGLAVLEVSLNGNCSGGKVTSAPAGISCPGGPCTMSVTAGDTVTLQATPGPGNCNFVNFSRPCDPEGMFPCVVKVERDTIMESMFWDGSLNHIGACGPLLPCGNGRFPDGLWRPYSALSPFNRRINRLTARGMANSDQIRDYMLDVMAVAKQPANWTAPHDGQGGWPTYWGADGDNVFTVGACTEFPCPEALKWRFYAPGGAVTQASGPDRHITTVSQTYSTQGLEMDLWHAPTSLSSGGGSVTPVSTGSAGVTTVFSEGLAAGTDGQGTAARFGSLAGRIRLEEIRDAIARSEPGSRPLIGHALTISVPCDNGHFVWPARNSDLACSNYEITPGVKLDDTNAPPMGARLWLNMSLDEIDLLPIPEWKRVVLRTMAVYGAIINDTGSQFYFSWQLEAGIQYGGPDADLWRKFGADMSKVTGTDWYSDGVTGAESYTGAWHNTDDNLDWYAKVWKRLVVLEPCVSDGTC